MPRLHSSPTAGTADPPHRAGMARPCGTDTESAQLKGALGKLCAGCSPGQRDAQTQHQEPEVARWTGPGRWACSPGTPRIAALEHGVLKSGPAASALGRIFRTRHPGSPAGCSAALSHAAHNLFTAGRAGVVPWPPADRTGRGSRKRPEVVRLPRRLESLASRPGSSGTPDKRPDCGEGRRRAHRPPSSPGAADDAGAAEPAHSLSGTWFPTATASLGKVDGQQQHETEREEHDERQDRQPGKPNSPWCPTPHRARAPPGTPSLCR